MSYFQIILLLISGAFLSSCEHPNTKENVNYFDPIQEDIAYLSDRNFESIDPDLKLKDEWLKPNPKPFILGVGDRVEIEILGIGGTRADTFVMPDGRVYFDLAGGVKAEGMTLDQLTGALTDALKGDYTAPMVNVTLVEVFSRRAWVLGRVSKPGLYPLSQPTTILESVAMAGGLFTSRMSGSTEELADLGNSFILRKGNVLPVNFIKLLKEGDMSQNIYLRDGDYIYMPSSSSQNVSVLGAVRRPQQIGFKDSISIIEALAKAGGPINEARMDQVVVIRGSISEPRVAKIDVAAIMRGDAKNIELRTHDVVWVPNRPLQKLRDYFWIIMNSAAQTVAIREGANSVEGAEVSPSLSIPISASPSGSR